MTDARKRLLAVLSDVAPDLAVVLWNDRDIRELPRNIRKAICDALDCKPGDILDYEPGTAANGN